jgi:hypothetical protein
VSQGFRVSCRDSLPMKLAGAILGGIASLAIRNFVVTRVQATSHCS